MSGDTPVLPLYGLMLLTGETSLFHFTFVCSPYVVLRIHSFFPSSIYFCMNSGASATEYQVGC
jgi:hypothetical protein